jgi:hypothetical protein
MNPIIRKLDREIERTNFYLKKTKGLRSRAFYEGSLNMAKKLRWNLLKRKSYSVGLKKVDFL